jgi:hypothetical protein
VLEPEGLFGDRAPALSIDLTLSLSKGEVAPPSRPKSPTLRQARGEDFGRMSRRHPHFFSTVL